MAKLITKISIPVILIALFATASLVAISYWQLPSGFYVIISLLIVFIFFSGLAIGQNLSSVVKRILNKAVELSEGNLSSRIDLETKDEFSELAKAFNKIAEELQANRLQQENMDKSIDIKVKARTKELEETIYALEQKVKNRTIELERMIEKLEKLQGITKSRKSEVSVPKKVE